MMIYPQVYCTLDNYVASITSAPFTSLSETLCTLIKLQTELHCVFSYISETESGNMKHIIKNIYMATL